MQKVTPELLRNRKLLRQKPVNLIGQKVSSLPADQSNNNDATNLPASQQIDKTKLEPVVSPVDDSLFSDVIEIPLDQLDSSEATIRKVRPTRSLEKLVNSIKKDDVIDPIVARRVKERYKIVCGHRRVEACRKLGRKTIKARLLKENVSIPQERRIQLVDNIDREDLKPIELARALYNYLEVSRPDLDLTGMISLFNSFDRMPIPSAQDAATVTAIKELIGKRSLSTVRNRLSLLKLPCRTIQAIENDKISYSNACILASHQDHPDIDNITTQTIQDRLKRDHLKEIFEYSKQTQDGALSKYFSRFINKLTTLEEEVSRFLKEMSSDDKNLLHEKFHEIRAIIERGAIKG
jgi:ParB family chromosome partitioning protein